MADRYKKLDPILNQQIRLAIISVLIKADSADFNFLKDATQATQGNLSRQLTKLKEAEYITITKSFEGNYPKTTCKITTKGINAFETYVEQIKTYLNI